MNTEAIINICAQQGIFLSVDAGSLQVDANKDQLTPEILTLLKANKAALVGYIEAFAQQQQALNRQQLTKSGQSGPAPLSFAQQRLWIVDRLAEGAAQSNISAPFLLEGTLNKAAMQQAIHAIVSRHQVLHSVYRETDNECRQHLLTPFDTRIAELDLSALSACEFDEQVRLLARQEALTPFDLANDVMLRVTLLKASEQRHVALFSMHHIASDGWSVGVFIKEFNLLYSAFCQGLPSPLPPLDVQYADYAHWQRGWMQGDVYDQELAYWTRQLDNAPPVHRLPLDKPRPAQPAIVGQKIKRTLSASQLGRLKALCKEQGVTLFMALQTLYALLVGQWSREDDIVMGTPVAGRMHQNAEPLIGFFLNNLVLRTDLSGQPTFIELLARNKKTLLDAFEHQHLPFDALVEAINPDRTGSHQALFQLWFVLQNHESTDFSLPGLTMSLLECDEFIHFDLSLEAIEKNGALELGWLYQADIFEAGTISALAQSFEVLLDNVLANPARPISQLSLLGAGQPQPALPVNSQAYPPHGNLPAMIARYSDYNPESTAIIANGQRLKYGQLTRQVNQFAQHLIAIGVTPGSLVGLCLPRSVDMLVATLGIMQAGAAYVPLDLQVPAERLQFILQESQAAALVTHSELAAATTALAIPRVLMDHHDWRQASDDTPAVSIAPDDLAYVLFTSGSTGRPKGVQVSHLNLTHHAYSMQQILADRGLVGSYNWAWNAPLVFDASVQALSQLAFGVELHLLSEDMRRSPPSLAAYLRDAEIDLLDTTPALAELLVSECLSRDIALPAMLIGGEAISNELWQTLAEHYAHNDAGSGLFALNVYGPTECTVNATYADIRTGSKPNIGQGLPNVSLHVMSPTGQHLPAGAKGELWIGGAGVAQGYLHNPELSAQRFVDSPEFGRLYKSGDLVRLNSAGQLEFIGRADFQVKLRGYRIELEEIESVALEHPAIDEIVVLVKEQQLIAFAVGAPHQHEPVMAYLAARLPQYMLPARLVLLDEMPLTPNGKRDRKALLAMEIDLQQTRHVAPATAMETAVHDIWCELLRQEQISVEANFFEIGGHSLLGIRLASACRERLGVELPLKVLMEGPTIRNLAAQCEWYEKQRQVLAASSQQSSQWTDAERIVI